MSYNQWKRGTFTSTRTQWTSFSAPRLFPTRIDLVPSSIRLRCRWREQPVQFARGSWSHYLETTNLFNLRHLAHLPVKCAPVFSTLAHISSSPATTLCMSKGGISYDYYRCGRSNTVGPSEQIDKYHPLLSKMQRDCLEVWR